METIQYAQSNESCILVLRKRKYCIKPLNIEIILNNNYLNNDEHTNCTNIIRGGLTWQNLLETHPHYTVKNHLIF